VKHTRGSPATLHAFTRTPPSASVSARFQAGLRAPHVRLAAKVVRRCEQRPRGRKTKGWHERTNEPRQDETAPVTAGQGGSPQVGARAQRRPGEHRDRSVVAAEGQQLTARAEGEALDHAQPRQPRRNIACRARGSPRPTSHPG